MLVQGRDTAFLEQAIQDAIDAACHEGHHDVAADLIAVLDTVVSGCRRGLPH